MSIPYILLSVLYIATCGALITIILLQKKRSAGLGAGMSGMGSSGQTYWDKNKGRSFEGSLERYTKILAIVLGLFTVLMCVIR